MAGFVSAILSNQKNSILYEYQKSGKFTDLTLCSSDGEYFQVHKNVLAASCQYFKLALEIDPELNSLIFTEQENVTKLDLEVILEYLYLNETTILPGDAKNLYMKCKFFRIDELQEYCNELLIKHVTMVNCLDYFRFSTINSLDGLKQTCKKFILENVQKFFKIYLTSLTYDELKNVISIQDLDLSVDQQKLYEYILTWIKRDPNNRKHYCEELLENVDFSFISFDYYENEILKDSIFYANPKLYTKLAQKFISRRNNGSTLVASASKKLFVVTNTSIYELDFGRQKWIHILTLPEKQLKHFTTSSLYENIYISGGADGATCFEVFDSVYHQMKTLPSMLQKRYFHKSIAFDNRIYCCSGAQNLGSTEYFDFEKFEWIYSPTLNEQKFMFGITASDNSIYACGGYTAFFRPTYKIERLDIREGNWKIILDDNDSEKEIDSSVLINNSIYCFHSTDPGYIFDIRSNKWCGTTARPIDIQNESVYNLMGSNVAALDNQIYGIFQKTDTEKRCTLKSKYI